MMEFNARLFQEQVIEGKKTALVDLWSPQCGPCLKMMPLLERLSKEYNIIKMNVDDHFEIASEWGISGIPTLILFRNGKEAIRLIGLQSEQTLRNLFKKYS